MSIELNWETLTTGPDGQELAHRIRDFIHSKFQTVPLPRFIKSVTVHDFEFGTIGPELELKDITDPLPDFYEADEDSEGGYDDGDDDTKDSDGQGQHAVAAGAGAPRSPRGPPGRSSPQHDQRRDGGRHRHDRSGSSLRTLTTAGGHQAGAGAGAGAARPGVPGGGGIPGGTSNLLHHFHNHLSPGWSGTQTPLAAMAGLGPAGGGGGGGGGAGGPGGGGGAAGYFPDFQHDLHRALRQGRIDLSNGPPAAGTADGAEPARRHRRNASSTGSSQSASGAAAATTGPPPLVRDASSLQVPGGAHPPLPLREKHSVSTLAPTSRGGGASTSSRPPTRGNGGDEDGDGDGDDNDDMDRTLLLGQAAAAAAQQPSPSPPPPPHRHEPRAEDLQAVFRIRYAGDVKLLLTADILLDYPMPSFVGIPVRLSITGLTFDGVGVLAYIRKRVHFCFLSPEDAVAAVGGDDDEGGGSNNNADVAASSAAAAAAAAVAAATATTPPPAGTGLPPLPPRQTRLGGLLQEVRVESEIGLREGGKQSLKNVGKVERFVLEQVRRIFEEELVYPSFWTFLV